MPKGNNAGALATHETTCKGPTTNRKHKKRKAVEPSSESDDLESPATGTAGKKRRKDGHDKQTTGAPIRKRYTIIYKITVLDRYHALKADDEAGARGSCCRMHNINLILLGEFSDTRPVFRDDLLEASISLIVRFSVVA